MYILTNPVVPEDPVTVKLNSLLVELKANSDIVELRARIRAAKSVTTMNSGRMSNNESSEWKRL